MDDLSLDLSLSQHISLSHSYATCQKMLTELDALHEARAVEEREANALRLRVDEAAAEALQWCTRRDAQEKQKWAAEATEARDAGEAAEYKRQAEAADRQVSELKQKAIIKCSPTFFFSLPTP